MSKNAEYSERYYAKNKEKILAKRKKNRCAEKGRELKKTAKYYMCVTADKYELPICVAESPLELSRFLGIQKSSLFCMLSRHQRVSVGCKFGKMQYGKIVTVPMEKAAP